MTQRPDQVRLWGPLWELGGLVGGRWRVWRRGCHELAFVLKSTWKRQGGNQEDLLRGYSFIQVKGWQLGSELGSRRDENQICLKMESVGFPDETAKSQGRRWHCLWILHSTSCDSSEAGWHLICVSLALTQSLGHSGLPSEFCYYLIDS